MFRGTNNFTTNHILIADGTGGQVDSAQVKYDKAPANTGNASAVSGVSVSSATFSGTALTVSLSGSVSGTAVGDHTYQPAGTVSKPNVSPTTSSVSASKINSWGAGTASTVPSLTHATVTFNNVTAASLASAPTFTGTTVTLKHTVTQGTTSVSGNYIPAGIVKVALTVSTAAHSHTIGSTSTAVSITADN